MKNLAPVHRMRLRAERRARRQLETELATYDTPAQRLDLQATLAQRGIDDTAATDISTFLVRRAA